MPYGRADEAMGVGYIAIDQRGAIEEAREIT